MRIVIENPLLGKLYPTEGAVVAVIDTGYEGFLGVPGGIFQSLSLSELKLQKRTLLFANGSHLTAEGAYSTVRLPEMSVSVDGFVETYAGLNEILLGAEALANFRIMLNYCSKRIKLEKCP
jgi:clan AA aspartic protease